MRDIKTQKGYTIVETLIVLAVTGVMFASTVALISGQVAKAQYRDTVFRVNQSIQNIINDVQNGVFNPSDDTCGDRKNIGESDCVYAGVRVNIDDTGKMTKDYLYLFAANATTTPTQAIDLSATGKEVTTLPGYVDYKPKNPASDLTFYVLFSNYSYDSANKGGAQSYTIKYTSGTNPNSTLDVLGTSDRNQFLCLVNGSRKAKIVVGQGGQLESKIEFQSGDC
jgi:type II secretory pathway pseudopilin PulG